MVYVKKMMDGKKANSEILESKTIWISAGIYKKCQRVCTYILYHPMRIVIFFVIMQCVYNITLLWMGDLINSELMKNLSTKLMTRFSFTQIFIALGLFLCFKKINIGSRKLINKMASTSLATYLIHVNPYFSVILWEDIMHISKAQLEWWYFIWIFCVTISIFIICMLVDLTRQKLFGILRDLIQSKN